MPFGESGAYWVLLGPDIQLRRTAYNLTEAAAQIRDTNYPQAQNLADHSILHPPSEDEMLKVFTRAELK
jgi:hypothetical protein